MARKQSNRQTAPRSNENENATPIEDRIRARAYEIWIRNGCRDGCDLEDWTEAEREIRAEATPQTMSSAA